MKNMFDVMLVLIVTLTMFISMMFFAEEVVIEQEAIHLRSRIYEIVEIEGGYTQNAKSEVKRLIDNSDRNIIVNVSKEGKLSYGERITFEVIIFYDRKIPFVPNSKNVKYNIFGEYYNINE